jgi:hypothetical protein
VECYCRFKQLGHEIGCDEGLALVETDATFDIRISVLREWALGESMETT